MQYEQFVYDEAEFGYFPMDHTEYGMQLIDQFDYCGYLYPGWSSELVEGHVVCTTRNDDVSSCVIDETSDFVQQDVAMTHPGWLHANSLDTATEERCAEDVSNKLLPEVVLGAREGEFVGLQLIAEMGEWCVLHKKSEREDDGQAFFWNRTTLQRTWEMPKIIEDAGVGDLLKRYARRVNQASHHAPINKHQQRARALRLSNGWDAKRPCPAGEVRPRTIIGKVGELPALFQSEADFPPLGHHEVVR